MSRPKLLDLFSGAGGCSMGYHRAGFDVTGVDIEPHPDYPFDFHCADAMTYPLDGFDAIHASPPCKAFTKTGWAFHFDYHDDYDDLLTPTRERLREWGTAWVIENVPGAPMRVDLELCGSMFGLGVRRHRWFEAGFPLAPFPPAMCNHSTRVVSPHGNPNRFKGTGKQWAVAMDIDWMRTEDLAQAIPPAYTQFIGEQLLTHLGEQAA